MTTHGFYRALADMVLAAHVSFVIFVVAGLFMILCGGFRGWEWVRNPWFRALHLGAIGLVVAQSWLGMICPLTILEMHLRDLASEESYRGTFISHWLGKLLYYNVPPGVFVVCYTLFGLAVIASWLMFRPRPFRRADPEE